MKLDVTVMRHMSPTEYRVLEAVEKGMLQQQQQQQSAGCLPLALIATLANLRHGGTHKIVSSLIRDKLLSHESGGNYRLTTAGYDILALRHLQRQGIVTALGPKIGTGKESDVYLAATPSEEEVVLKFHRLGRTSFRAVQKKRDYTTNSSSSTSWLWYSRLSATKEYAFVQALYRHDYPTPQPMAHNRHVVVLSYVRNGMPLYQIVPKRQQLSHEQIRFLYQQLLHILKRLAVEHGLIHCDFNEFNVLVTMPGKQEPAMGSIEEEGKDEFPLQETGMGTNGDGEAPPIELEGVALRHKQQQKEEEDMANREPIITLIDFPQMISIQHPNAQELYERDLHGLQRFFQNKLHYQDEVEVDASWEAVMAALSSAEASAELSDDDASKISSTSSSHRRLDAELKASGFNGRNIGRQLELFYFQAGPKPVESAVMDALQEEEEGDNDDVDDDDDGGDVERCLQLDENNFTNKQRQENQLPSYRRDQAAAAADDDDDDDHATNSNMEKVDDREPGAAFMISTELNPSVQTERQQQDTCVVFDTLALKDDDEVERLKEKARIRVRKQLDGQKRKNRKKDAVRKPNNNKSYIKGKRVLSEATSH